MDRSTKQREGKTPYEIFLEDDGPYSRRLFAPVTSQPTKHGTFIHKKCEKEETKTQILRKGLLWHREDRIFSRKDSMIDNNYVS